MLQRDASHHAQWAVNEFAQSELPDQRLCKRLIKVATDFAQDPTASIPQACESASRSKAAYRFFDNDDAQPELILGGHFQATLARMRSHAVVLCLQDTTDLNYSTHRRTRGLGPISNNRDKTLGLFLHSTLTVTPSGQPLGFVHVRSWARTTATFGRSSNARNRTPRHQKESQKWMDSFQCCQHLAAQCPNTVLVNIADREGDLYDLFQEALKTSGQGQVHCLVRAQHNRRVNHPQQYLWKQLAARRVSGYVEVRVPAREGQLARIAKLAIRFTAATLQPPCLKEHEKALTMYAVEARELHGPKTRKAICWRLLTTLPVESFEAACEKVLWYAQRWQIEVMHKVLKSGCKIEQRQLQTAERLKRVLMVDLVVAWRVMDLCRAARQSPDQPADQWLESEEWRALRAYHEKGSKAVVTPPTIREAVRWIARLGGFLARKSDGEPGTIVIWRGLSRLKMLASAWIAFQEQTKCG
jgi:hypothetical protein